MLVYRPTNPILEDGPTLYLKMDIKPLKTDLKFMGSRIGSIFVSVELSKRITRPNPARPIMG